MIDSGSIKEAFNRVNKYVIQEHFKGWDLFDGLNSTFFKSSEYYRYSALRLAWIQFFKRSPVNLRAIAGVPKGYNAKGLGLFASGLVLTQRPDEAKRLLHKLNGMACQGYQGKAWGYNFDWQARAFFVPDGKPNMVSSVFVANAFLDYFDRTRDQTALDIGRQVCDFIINHLILFEDHNTLCFGYIPKEKARVHNASMLGAALLARLYSYTGNSLFLEKSRKAMAYSVSALSPDGSWPYGERSHHRFVDNFHTGFNLVSLAKWMEYTEEKHWENDLKRAYQYYIKTFWLDDGCPKYYNNALYPIDIHCSAQGIVTALKLKAYDDKHMDLAIKIARWSIQNMQSKEGFFYHQKTKLFTNKIPYIRWGQAWMFFALSLLLSRLDSSNRGGE